MGRDGRHRHRSQLPGIGRVRPARAAGADATHEGPGATVTCVAPAGRVGELPAPCLRGRAPPAACIGLGAVLGRRQGPPLGFLDRRCPSQAFCWDTWLCSAFLVELHPQRVGLGAAQGRTSHPCAPKIRGKTHLTPSLLQGCPMPWLLSHCPLAIRPPVAPRSANTSLPRHPARGWVQSPHTGTPRCPLLAFCLPGRWGLWPGGCEARGEGSGCCLALGEVAASRNLDLKPDDSTWKWIKSHFFPRPLLAPAAPRSREPLGLWHSYRGVQTPNPVTLGTTGSAQGAGGGRASPPSPGVAPCGCKPGLARVRLAVLFPSSAAVLHG